MSFEDWWEKEGGLNGYAGVEMLRAKAAWDAALRGLLLNEYVNDNHNGNKAAFARACGVLPQQVTQWVNGGYIVVDGTLYSPRRELGRSK